MTVREDAAAPSRLPPGFLQAPSRLLQAPSRLPPGSSRLPPGSLQAPSRLPPGSLQAPPGSLQAPSRLLAVITITCAVQHACSESKVLQRKAVSTPASLEEDIQTVINQLHSLSEPKVQIRSGSDPLPVEGVDLNAYYRVITNLYMLLQPLLREGFMEDLPKTLVCVLSGKQDCGLEAELIKAVSVEMGPAIIAALSSLTSPSCSPLGKSGESYSFFTTYLRMSDSTKATLTGIQDIFVNILTYFPVSGNLVNAVSSLVDTVVRYTLEVLFSVLEVPVDYIKIALQFGVQVPTLDEQGKCEHGDLKQLIMWGLRHNVSWSFGTALIDILLEVALPPDPSICAYPGPNCPSPGLPFQRSLLNSNDNIDTHRNTPLQCDPQNLAELNDTICPEIVSGLRQSSSVSVLMFCQALSSLNAKQIKLVWSNACYVFEAAMSPLTSRTAADCPAVGTFPPPVINPTSAPLNVVPVRRVREASNLNQLACNYNSWLDNISVDPVLVSLCGDNQREEFVKRVCSNATLVKKLVSDSTNLWLYAYCGNSSADVAYMVTELCLYEQWMFQASVINPYLLEFCTILDKERLSLLICQNIGFYMLLFSSPANVHLMPNCSQVLPMPVIPDTDVDTIDPCQYSLWQDVSLIHLNVITICAQFDANDFNREVCANQSFLNRLLDNKLNEWLRPHCAKAVLEIPYQSNDQRFNTTEWCDYQMWASRYVDDSVVGLCWQHDQVAFQKNVCCNLGVFQRLLQDPRNAWLRSVCNETEEMEKAQLIQQVCKYADWTTPIIVDMTEVAVCAVADPDNFVSKVCRNDTVLKNLLANQDNTWLIQHCSNHTKVGGQGTVGFNPSEQCLYLSWSVSLPDPVLITMCWKQDQAHFASTICPNPNLLSALTREPSSAWVASACATYANLTNGGTVQPHVCLAQDVVKKFNWTCSQHLILACQPGAGQNVMMQMIARCWLENVRSRMAELLTPEVSAVLDQAASLAVVSFFALEEIQNTTYHVAENVRLDILMSVDVFLKKETDFVKKRVLLQCFGRVLTSLMQVTRDITQEEFGFIQEYFNIPVDNLREVLSGSHITTIRMILLYYTRHKNTLQLPEKYMSTLASVLFQTHLAADGSLFSDLASLLALVSPADIQGLPRLQNNINVRETINLNLDRMTLDQRRAFGAWFGTVMLPINITRGQQSLIRDTGNLIAYLPFYNFQHLSAAQLLDGLDMLQQNTLSPIQREFIAQSLIGTYKNLTAQDFLRLGNITCWADPEDLIVYKGTEAFPVIQDLIRNCIRNGLNLPSHMLSRLLLNSTQFNDSSKLTVEQMKDTAPLMPMLGVSFIQSLSPSQLLDALPLIKSVTFSPAQAAIIVDKLSSVMKMNSPGTLQQLGSLVLGVKSEFLLTLTSEKLLSSLPSMAQQTPSFSPVQANAIATRLWGFLDVPSWLTEVEPLLYCTPLVSVLPRTPQLVNNLTISVTKPWNTQQAQAIFNKVLELKPRLIKEDFESLGTAGQGVSCKVLLERLRAKRSPSSVKAILLVLRQQPSLLHTSLKKCVADEVYQYKFFPEVLAHFGAELALAMPVSTVKKFTVDLMQSLKALIVAEPQYFLLLSRRKQELLVDKIVQRLRMYTGVYTEEEFRSLGIMATFVNDEILIQLDRTFFMENINFLHTFCYSATKMDIVARILQDTNTFGPVKTWTKATLSQVGRFLFFLPTNKLQELPQELMTVARIEKLFMDQRQWEVGPIGSHCIDANERRSNFKKQQFVLQFFLGFLKVLSTPMLVPTCAILHSTTPSVWTSTSLTSMSSSEFVNCLELMGQDPFLPSYHRNQLLQKVKKIHGPVSSFSPSLISQLGRIAVEMTNEELSSLQLAERNTIAVLGAVDLWTTKQQEILFAAVLDSTKQRVSQLDSSTLVALGYIVCGAKASEIIYFNAVEFSKAVHYLGQLKLQCTEDQLSTMVGLLNHALAFGPTPFWGTDVFIEIGIIAAGIPDFDMSSLVSAQIEGITPLAISVIPPAKFTVVLSHQQISMFSNEQAEAVSPTVIDALSYMQKRALAMVLTPWEDRPVDLRGRSLGLALSHCPVCLLLGLLMLLVIPS
ncbi:uncharacterized protein strc1 [Eucyclogobius newberryi]|uniref:uncharacterized protein strc1 n=1 Tax=Eucyclogobius newberryi TaxID=166745 RepID=UPI003B5B8066